PMPMLQPADRGQGDSGHSSGSLSSARSPDTPPSNDSEGLSLSLVPERPVVSSGETFSVEVVLTEARGITSVPFHLRFDPEILEYVGIRTGPALNGRSLQPIVLGSVNPRRPGDLAVGLSLVRSSGTFSGSGALLSLD